MKTTPLAKCQVNKPKNILVMSPEWPNYDKSSGGMRLFNIIKILAKKNKVFYFTHENDENGETYIKDLKDLNVKIFNKDIIKNLKELSEKYEFDFIFLHWWEVAESYSDIVKKLFPKAKLIIDTVDVHWIREERGGISNEQKKKREIETYKKSDIVLTVTKEDAEEVYKECENTEIKILSNIHKESFKKHKKGKDIMFLGGFKHTPNIDAALRCIEIYKNFIKETNNKCKLYIVGNNPPEEIKKLAKDNDKIIITGYVKNISKYFKKSKVFLAPITWGAGIKGKICESIMHKVPVITTSIGGEGFNLNNFEDIFIADKDEEILSALKIVYGFNNKQIKKITKSAYKKNKNIFSVKSAKTILDSIIEKNPPCVISIVTYKRKEQLKKCLDSIFEKTLNRNFLVVVTDNGQCDETKELTKNYENVKYIRNKKNEYFSKPNNKIISNYKKCDIVLINDDIIIESHNWLEILQETAYSEANICCVGGKGINKEKQTIEAGSLALKNGSAWNLKEEEKKQFVGYCSGCLLYLRRDAISKIGLLDESFYPMYYEDTDWQYRAHMKDLKTIYQPKFIYTHEPCPTKEKGLSFMKKAKEIFKNKYKNINIEKYNQISKWELLKLLRKNNEIF